MNGGHRYDFEWDAQKAKQNVRKHGVSFERAATVFLDPNALSIFDPEHSAGEDRWITLGMDWQGVMLVVPTHSARWANKPPPCESSRREKRPRSNANSTSNDDHEETIRLLEGDRKSVV